jgi:hypothetical protein
MVAKLYTYFDKEGALFREMQDTDKDGSVTAAMEILDAKTGELKKYEGDWTAAREGGMPVSKEEFDKQVAEIKAK